jgi:hypothetical protein
MLEDRFGQTLSTDSDAAVGEYIRGMDLLLSSNLGALEAADTAINEDSDFALAHALRARALQMLARIPEAKSAINRAVDLLTRATPREQAHIQVLVYLLDGRGSEALTALRAHLANYPRDALPLSLALGVYGLIGFSGRLDHYEMQRDLLLQLAPHWGDDWWFNTYLGWSLVETGDCLAGADLLDASLAVNPRNASAAHGRAHGYYEMGEAEAGLQFIDSWLSTYDPASPLHCHLAWHAAMFAFHLGDAERAMSEYAQYIQPENAHSSPMFTLIDNAAFLWRALTYGHPLCTSPHFSPPSVCGGLQYVGGVQIRTQPGDVWVFIENFRFGDIEIRRTGAFSWLYIGTDTVLHALCPASAMIGTVRDAASAA